MPKLPLNELRRIVRLHMNWLLMATLGKDAITPEEYEELRQYGKLPLESLDLAESSYLLGRLKSLLTSKEYKEVTLEKLREEKKTAVYTESERLAIDHAKLVAAASMKRIQDEIADGIYDQFSALSGQILTAETIRGVVRDEVVSALEQRKTAQQLASSLASKFQTTKKDWLKVAKTELHRSKMMGVAQAISNRLGPYSSGDGPDSNVVVIPAPQCCEDCALHFLDENGNPRVFKLRDLLAAGSNADPGTSHKKHKGLHIHWKTTLPPLHPNCGCTVQYLPPGTGYENGKMVIKSLTQYEETIRKAEHSGGIGNPTAKPPGPPQPSKPATPSTQAGSEMSTPKVGKGPKGPKVKYVPKDSVATRPAGTIGETDHSYKVIAGMKAGKTPTKEQQDTINREKVKDATEWGRKKNSAATKINHYTHGKIALSKNLGDVEGANLAGLDKQSLRKVTIEGNGNALMKPPHEFPAGFDPDTMSPVAEALAQATGFASVPHGRGHMHEAGSYNMHAMFGLHDHVPVTAVRREADGSVSSMSEWLEDHQSGVNLRARAKDHGGNNAAALLASCPADKRDRLREKLHENVAMGIVLNDNDAHWGNTMVSEDFSDIKFIDKTFSGGNSLDGHLNSIHGSMHRNGMKVRIPDRLNEKFTKTTFHDMIRGNNGHYSDWQVAQSYLRMRFVQHVQNTVGHVDFEYFKPTIQDGSGQTLPHPNYWEGVKTDDHGRVLNVGPEFEARRTMGTLPSQVFESWAKHYVDSAAGDPSHPDHHSAKAIKTVGPFMPKGAKAMKDPSRVRREGKHQEYADNIVARDIPKNLSAGYPTAEAHADAQLIGDATKESKPMSPNEMRSLGQVHDHLKARGGKWDDSKDVDPPPKPAQNAAASGDDEDASSRVPNDTQAEDFSEFDKDENASGEEPDSTRVEGAKAKDDATRPDKRVRKSLWISAENLHRRLTM